MRWLRDQSGQQFEAFGPGIGARLSLGSTVKVVGGFIGATNDFALTKHELFELSGKGDDLEDSAFRFMTTADVETPWDNQHYLVFTLFAKDSLTGFGKVFSQRYDVRSDAIKTGDFVRGASMDIVYDQPLAAHKAKA